MLALALIAALQAPTVPEGTYTACEITEAGSLNGPTLRVELSFFEIPNYTFMQQPGIYELRGAKVHWVSGPLKDRVDGEYDAETRTVRFQPAGSFIDLPIAAVISCSLPPARR